MKAKVRCGTGFLFFLFLLTHSLTHSLHAIHSWFHCESDAEHSLLDNRYPTCATKLKCIHKYIHLIYTMARVVIILSVVRCVRLCASLITTVKLYPFQWGTHLHRLFHFFSFSLRTALSHECVFNGSAVIQQPYPRVPMCWHCCFFTGFFAPPVANASPSAPSKWTLLTLSVSPSLPLAIAGRGWYHPESKQNAQIKKY